MGESFITIILESIKFWARWFAKNDEGKDTFYLKTYKYLIT